ncbi:MAG: hypothetical protein HY961_17965 [Ignavibacteriae bacterium]|nr:hypothetical protein [Ignavibacteriota bacterium]
MTYEQEHKKVNDESVARGYETSDVNPRSVFISGLIVSIGLTIVGLAMAAGVYMYYKSASAHPGASANTLVMPESTALPPQPRLQTDPHVTLGPFVKQQDSVLASYGWVSKDVGVARIPIERAMKLIVERGLPVEKK